MWTDIPGAMGLILSCGECREHAQQYVLEALAHPAIHHVDFTFGCLRVTPWNMRAIASLIGQGKIASTFDLQKQRLAPGTAANYNVKTDTFTIGEMHPPSVVHEAIHALQDHVKFPTKVTEAEATAYLGQSVYSVVRESMTTGRSVDDVIKRHEQGSSIFAIAAQVGRQLGMLHRCGAVVTQADLMPIEQAIAGHPVYKPFASGNYPFNGTR
jgi:hypothetical protein